MKICKKYNCQNKAMTFHPSGFCFPCYQSSSTYFKNRPRLKVLDLFSGLGGFSEAFVQNGDQVLRIENNPLLSGVPHTTLMDVKKLRDIIAHGISEGDLNPYLTGIDVILASPPCYEFSLAFNSPQGIASRNGEFDNYIPDMELIQITMEIIEMLKPRYYIIENVRGSIRHFEKMGLIPNQKFKAYVFYGKFPKFSEPQIEVKKMNKGQHGDPLRANYRALIPFELSDCLRRAIIEQKTIFDYQAGEEE